MSAEALWPIPADWCWTQITQLGDVVSGGTPSSKEPKYWGGDINWISPADLTGYKEKFISKGAKSITQDGLINSSAKLMPAGSIHFSSRAPIGYVAISSSPMTTNQGFKSLIPFTGVFNEYVYYYLKASKQLAEKRASGTTFLELSGKAFGLLPVPLPPPNEQKRIVAKIEELFSELDNGVAALKTAREQLKVYRQAVLKHAFEGKLTAQWRAENQDKLESPQQLLTRIQQEREARYQQQLEEWKAAVKEWEAKGKEGKKPGKPKALNTYSEIAPTEFSYQLPQGWSWQHLGALITGIDQGWSPRCENVAASSNSWGVIKTTAVQHGLFNDEENKALPKTLMPKNQHELKVGDILVTRAGPRVRVGVCCLVKKVREKLMNCDKVYRIRAMDGLCQPEYLEVVLNSPMILDMLESVKSGINDSGVNLNQGAFLDMLIPYCSMEEQLELISKVDESLSVINKQQETIEAVIKQAETLRQSILKKAFSGQLVPQDPNDEPASELLARIQAEKAAANARKKAAAKSKVSAKPAARRGNLSRVTP